MAKDTIADFKEARKEDIDMLMAHFASKGSEKAFPHVEALLYDILDDAIDIWIDDHLGSADEGCADY